MPISELIIREDYHVDVNGMQIPDGNGSDSNDDNTDSQKKQQKENNNTEQQNDNDKKVETELEMKPTSLQYRA